MKLEQLQIFAAVVKAGSFARAANEILLISQPAVSASIRKLEESLGFALFDRESYRPTLTKQGQAFYERARRLIADAEALGAYAGLLAAGVEPELRIAFDPLSLQAHLLQVLKGQTRCFAQTHFEFVDEQVGGAIARLMDGEADLALGTWVPTAYATLPLERHKLFSFTMSTLVAADYPLLQGEGELLPEELAGSVQIVMRTSERFLPSGGFGLQASARYWYVNDQQTKQLLIEAGLGFGSLPHPLVARELAAGKLVPFKRMPGYRVIPQEVHVFRRSDRSQGPVAEALWQALTALPFREL
ncbi:MAG TPA: LysR family transcriptional regulator [Candidatus Obscuribacterales bacterium]